MTTCEIKFDSPEAIYYSGQSLTAQIEIKFEKPKKLRSKSNRKYINSLSSLLIEFPLFRHFYSHQGTCQVQLDTEVPRPQKDPTCTLRWRRDLLGQFNISQRQRTQRTYRVGKRCSHIHSNLWTAVTSAFLLRGKVRQHSVHRESGHR